MKAKIIIGILLFIILPPNLYGNNRAKTQDLIAYWPIFNRDDTVLYDVSSYNNHGQVFGGAQGVNLMLNALLFDGNDDYAVIPSAESLNFTDKFSLSLWFLIKDYPVNFTKRQSEMIWGRGSRFMCGFEQDKVDEIIWLRCYIKYQDGKTQEAEYNVSRYLLNDSEWHHLGIAFEKGNLFSMYIDGMLVDQEKPVTNAPLELSATNSSFAIGARIKQNGTIDRQFAGWIDEIKLFRKLLSPTEMNKLFKLGL